MARLPDPAAADAATAPTLSIVVPAYDDERRIGRLLDTLARTAEACAGRAGYLLLEIVVVDDGSTDSTAASVESAAALDGRVRLLRLERNRGKGAAVRAGMLAALGDVALLTDTDLSTPLDDLEHLARELADGADIAIGSRALPGSVLVERQPAYRELLGKTFNLALRLLTGLPFRDTQCGFKLFRLDSTRTLFRQQRVDGFAFDAELCVLARAQGLSVVEVPVRWRNDPQSHVTPGRTLRMAVDLVRIARVARTGGGTAAAPTAHLDRPA